MTLYSTNYAMPGGWIKRDSFAPPIHPTNFQGATLPPINQEVI